MSTSRRPSATRRRQRKIRIGVFGAGRGNTMINVLAQHPDAELVAICDRYRPLLDRSRAAAAARGGRIAFYEDPERFLAHDLDAVVLANYANEHAPWAIKAMESGRHVVSEVLAVQNLDEAVRLAEAVERTKRIYAYAENYCYFRGTQEIRRLYAAGELGEFQHGEGEYVHDCVPIWPDIAYGDPEHWRNRMSTFFYCTHSLGPVLTITGTRPVRVVGFETPSKHPETGMRMGSSAMISCQMSNGATVKSLHACQLVREPSAVWYCIYGSKGMAETDRWGGGSNCVNVHRQGDPRTAFQQSYMPRFPVETALSRRIGGHGGSDFYTMHFFLERILGRADGSRLIDVYTALDMTVPGILAHRSALAGNAPQEVPDFRDRKARERFRGDTACCDPRVAGDRLLPSSMFPVRIPAGAYARQRRIFAAHQAGR